MQMAKESKRFISFAKLFVCITLLGVLSEAWATSIGTTADVGISVGVNKFDLFMQYMGTASRGDGRDAHRRVTHAMARKALIDAREAGIRMMRVSLVGYSPAKYGGRRDLELWITNPNVFWGRVDEMFDDLDANSIQLVPVLMWNAAQFPAMTGETLGELIRNPDSKSWKLLSSYVTDFITRYRGRRTILFYELTNELNLLVDIDNVSRCNRMRSEEQCKISSNFSTDDLIEFTRRYATLIRGLDGTRLISSGFSVPRSAAEHLRPSPGRLDHPNWTADSRGQFRKNLKDIHMAVDIISIHLYAGKQNQRFGSTSEMEVLAEAKLASVEAGKPLFVGEFGEPDSRNANPSSHTALMMEKILELKIPYSAVWAWEFYQHRLFKTDDGRDYAFNLEPGYTDFLIREIREANDSAKHKIPAIDRTPPRVVLTWPLECSVLKAPVNLHAVASDDSGAIKKVDFLLDGGLVGDDDGPPYQAALSVVKLKTGAHRLTARAYDFSGNAAEFSSDVIVGDRSTDKANCTGGIE